jgi:HEAT repeat protein
MLTRGDRAQRTRAIEMVRSVGSDAVPVLLAELDERPVPQIWDALEAVGPAAAAAVLERSRARGQPLTWGEARVLGQSEAGWGVVLEATASSDPIARAAAAVGLGRSSHREAASRARALLADPDAGVRSEAATALGRLQDAESRDTLRSLVADEDEDVRASAGWALAQLGTHDALEAATAFLDDPSVAVRVAMIDTLAPTGAMRTATLIRLLRGADPGIGTGSEINAILDALVASPDPDAEPALLELLSAPHATWRSDPKAPVYGDQAAAVLDRIGTPAAVAAAAAWRSSRRNGGPDHT